MADEQDRVERTIRFNYETYASYYKGALVDLRYDLIYRSKRIADLLERAGIYPSAPGFAAFEYGFGAGHLLRVVSAAEKVVGFEFSPSAVERAQKAAPPGHPSWEMREWADATSLPLPSGAFDLVTASHVLEHLDDDHAALAELVRITRPGGHVLIILPANERLFEGSKHLRLYALADFCDAMASHGLEQVLVDEHQRFDRPWKDFRVILQSRRGPLRKAIVEGTKAVLFLPPAALSWKLLARVDDALAAVGAKSTSIAYLFRKPDRSDSYRPA
ncbi:MAG TPA: class I SAM-dependent methyltransferase [Nannocystaceae bacterium]|nr:class I SAM-dependent methyltransferase [Nannocystaceae bacterium]